jgi:RNA polymerase sigma factor (sigma-70 family)
MKNKKEKNTMLYNRNLNVDIDNNNYYYRLTKNKRNHLVQQRVSRPKYLKEDVMRLQTLETYDTNLDNECVIVNNCLEKIKQDEIKEKISQVLSTLTEREERILRMRFGINTKEHTLDEIGQLFSVTGNRISMIEAKALRKLKHKSRSEILREYVQND